MGRIIDRDVVFYDKGSLVTVEAGTELEDDHEYVKSGKIGDHCFRTGNEVDLEADLDYESMTVPELAKVCEDRGVEPKSSRKADIIAALENYDRGGLESREETA